MDKQRILIVDDESKVARSCVRILELEGFEATDLTDPTLAMAYYQEHEYDLVLLDLKMPQMDGLEVLAQLKEYDPNALVVLFTAYGTKASVVEAFRLGAAEYLEKPLNAKVLIDTIQRILAQGRERVVRGNLRSMSLPSIVQINCTEMNQARLSLRRKAEEATLYFEEGNVVHAVMQDETGEEVVYKLLGWADGEFELEMGIEPPAQSITVAWSSLLLEGMRRLDEGLADIEQQLDELEQSNETKWFEESNTQSLEETEMATTRKRSDVLAEHLQDLLSGSSDISGAVVVGHDGLVLASNMPMAGHDSTRVGAEGAALLGLSQRTLKSLGRGEFEAAVLEGKDGWVIAVNAGARAVVLGLTAAGVNLGMALLEMRDLSADVAEVMG